MRFVGALFFLAVLPAAAEPDLAAGRKLAQKCEPCHAVGASGESPLPIAPRFRDLARRYPLENLQEALAEGIVVAHNAPMPEFRFTGAEIDAFLAYLASIQTKK